MISKKCDYALRAMLELAIHEGKGPVTIGHIAKARNIPVRFLEAIMRQLKQANLADSARGKEGGYFLTKPAHGLSVGLVIDLFEGRIGHKVRASSHDIFNELWQEADAAIQSVYRRTSFADLAEKELHRHHADAANYSI